MSDRSVGGSRRRAPQPEALATVAAPDAVSAPARSNGAPAGDGARTLRVAMVAGEASGDLLGADLIEALRERVGSLSVEGIGGPRMGALGCSSLYPMERLSVTGLTEAVGRYRELIPLRRRLARRFAASRPDVFIGIDAPDFNVSLERVLRRAGVPTVHYVSPSVWAWRRYRLPKIRAAADRVLCLFPFEEAFLAGEGIPAAYVGHPLADRIPMHTDRKACRRALGLDPDGLTVAMLPGSRANEVARLAAVLVEAAEWLAVRRERIRFLVPLVDAATRKLFDEALAGAPSRLEWHLYEGRAREVMGAADAIVLASGTATLEALLIKRPMVITYRTSALTYQVMRRMLHVAHVGLPNLLAGRSLVPELLQTEARPERLGAAVLALLAEPGLNARLEQEFARIHRSLRQGASRRAAAEVLALLEARS